MELPTRIDRDLLTRQISAEIARIEKNRNRDKSKAKRVTLFLAGGSAGTTMLLSLSKFTPMFESMFQSGSIIVGTMTTVVFAWDKLFDHKKLWVISAQTVRELYHLKEKMEHTSARDDWSEDVSSKYYCLFCEIIAAGDLKWDQIRNQK
jgi:hypothetical protein